VGDLSMTEAFMLLTSPLQEKAQHPEETFSLLEVLMSQSCRVCESQSCRLLVFGVSLRLLLP
jgi:hypothetical protein